jgi:hypothetical protein
MPHEKLRPLSPVEVDVHTKMSPVSSLAPAAKTLTKVTLRRSPNGALPLVVQHVGRDRPRSQWPRHKCTSRSRNRPSMPSESVVPCISIPARTLSSGNPRGIVEEYGPGTAPRRCGLLYFIPVSLVKTMTLDYDIANPKMVRQQVLPDSPGTGWPETRWGFRWAKSAFFSRHARQLTCVLPPGPLTCMKWTLTR